MGIGALPRETVGSVGIVIGTATRSDEVCMRRGERRLRLQAEEFSDQRVSTEGISDDGGVESILLEIGGATVDFRRSKVDCFFKIAVEKRCLDIHLVAFHVEMIDKCKEHTDGVSVCNRSKQLVKVNSFNLREPFSNPTRFISRRFAGFPINFLSVHPSELPPLAYAVVAGQSPRLCICPSLPILLALLTPTSPTRQSAELECRISEAYPRHKHVQQMTEDLVTIVNRSSDSIAE